MYRDTRPRADSSVMTSTPAVWAKNFAGATTINRRKMLRLAASKEWRLIRRYVPRGSGLLVAGCDSGEWAAFLNAKGYGAEGFDFSPELIERLRSAYPDLKWTEGVIEHDESGPGTALREFHRLLRPGDVTVVTVPSIPPHSADRRKPFTGRPAASRCSSSTS